jgi:squalene-associated FAD-dependent desaturase
MSDPPRAVVVGSGFAGVAAAVELARRGALVTLLEARRRPGGRASSFIDPESGETLDNGQHLLMGCYAATRSLLRELGTEPLVPFQRRLSITMVEEGGRAARLSCPPLPSPAHLIGGLLTFKGLTLADKLSLLRAAPRLMSLSGNGHTVEAWLDELGQTENLRDRFWRPLAVAALNEDTKVAGAELLTGVLQAAFGGGASASGLGFPRSGLSDLYVEPAAGYLSQRGGEIRTGSPVESIETRGGRAVAVHLRDGGAIPCEGVVLAVPHTSAGRLLPRETRDLDPSLDRLEDLGSSAIVSVNVWFDRPVTGLAFFGLVGGTAQFVFNKSVLWDQDRAKGTYLACVMSAASGLAARPNEEVTGAALEDLRRFIPDSRQARVTRTLVVREKQATFSGRPEILYLRPSARTAIPNLALAGDWTDTGLPGTIEGAVKSGVEAARTIRMPPL